MVDLHKSARHLVTQWLAYATKAGVDFSSKQKLECSLGFLSNSIRQAIVQSYAMVIDEACKFSCSIKRRGSSPRVASFLGYHTVNYSPRKSGLALTKRLLQVRLYARAPRLGLRICASSRTCSAFPGRKMQCTLATRCTVE